LIGGLFAAALQRNAAACSWLKRHAMLDYPHFTGRRVRGNEAFLTGRF
jgi:hypothetical protein